MFPSLFVFFPQQRQPPQENMPLSLLRHKWEFCVLAAPLPSLQEEKQGLQKDEPSEGSNIKNTLKK
jgi:hypothetical protein